MDEWKTLDDGKRAAGKDVYRRRSVATLLFTALFFSLCPVAGAHYAVIHVGDTYMVPNDVHIYSDDSVIFVSDETEDGEPSISFGQNCEADSTMNTKYGFPGSVFYPAGSESEGTVLYVYNTAGCKSSVARITIHDKSSVFEGVIARGTTVHMSGSHTYNSLEILGDILLDGDTAIIVTGEGMPSSQLESFIMSGSISCNLATPATAGSDGLNGYNLTLEIQGLADLTGGTIDLSGTDARAGAAGAAGVAPVCKKNYYAADECYDKPECKITPVTDACPIIGDGCDTTVCGCCYDQALQAGGNGGDGGAGGNGGNGGTLTIVASGDLWEFSPYKLLANGGAGGDGGKGGSGTGGCNQLKCTAIVTKATAGVDGAGGAAGTGGKAGTIQVTLPGFSEMIVDYLYSRFGYVPSAQVAASACGGAGGTGGTGGSARPGKAGGDGGTIAINAGCTSIVAGALKNNLKAYGGNGGTGGNGSTQVSGGKGGKGGVFTVDAATFKIPILHYTNGTSIAYVPLVHGGDGGGALNGNGGAGGDGGTMTLTYVTNSMAPNEPQVQGGSGGSTTGGTQGAAGADGAYTATASSAQATTVTMSAGGTATQGELLEYTILIHPGASTLTNAVVSVSIPANTTFVSAEGSHTVGNDTVTWQLDEVAACRGTTLTMLVQVDPNCPVQTAITCKATVTGDGQEAVVSNTVETVVEDDSENSIDSESILGYGKNQVLTSEPVNPALGNYVYFAELFGFPGKGLPVRFVAAYNSRDNSYDGPLGVGWTHNFNVRLSLDNSSGTAVVTIKWGDGHKEYFQRGDSSYVPVRCYTDVVLSDLSTGGYQAAFPDGTRYTFGQDGNLSEIKDLNGNTVTLSYTDATYPDYVTGVVDTAGRVIELSYTGGVITGITGPLTSVGFTYGSSGDLTGITDGRGNTRTFKYDAGHRLLQCLDPAGHTLVTNTYDDSGRVVSQENGLGEKTTYGYTTTTTGTTTVITPPSGNAVTHAFDRNYNLVSTVDGEGANAQFAYNGLGKCIEATDKKGNTIVKSYDGNGNPITLTDRLGRSSVAEYNDLNRAVSIEDPLGKVSTATYDAKGNMITLADPLGSTTAFTVNSAGLPTSMTSPSGLEVSTTYNTLGLPTKVADSLGYATTFDYDQAGRMTGISGTVSGQTLKTTITYDANGNPAGVEDPMGFLAKFTYDVRNNLTQRQVVPLNAVFRYEYDLLNRVTKMVDPLKGETTYEYDSDGNVTSVTDPDGVTTSFSYDKSNRLVQVTYPWGGVAGFVYDENGNRTSMTDATGKVWKSTYDAENRLVSTTDPLGKKVTRTYDALGRMIALTDEAGRTVKAEYDGSGRVVKKTLPDGSTLKYTYDKSGKLITATDELNRSWAFTYDKAERPLTMTDPNGKSSKYTYDGLGRLAQRVDRDGGVTKYKYDGNSRVTSITLPGSVVISFTYDAAGRILSAKNSSSGKVSRTYDKMGRVLTITDEKGKILKYTYSGAGRVSSVTYPGGKKVSYGYDDAGRLSTVTDWAKNVTTYHYDKLNRVASIDLPNGTRTTRSYDSAGRLSVLKHLSTKNVVIASYTLTYDATGQILQEKRQEPVVANPAASSSTFQYSKANRLTSGKTDGKAATYGFDVNGNMISKKMGTASTTYGYDDLNRLVSVKSASGTTSYTYDELGNRSSKNHKGTVTRYLSNGNTPHFKYSSSGAAKEYLVYGGALLYSVDAAGKIYVYHGDERGNVAAVTDGNGKVAQAVSYDPYGRVLNTSGTFDSEILFLGMHGVQADENGLYYTHARYYDPTLMRFLTEDPLGLSAGFNLYAYAEDNPISRMDPTGLDDQQSSTGSSSSSGLPNLPDWVGYANLGLNYLGLGIDPATKAIRDVVLQNYNVLYSKTEGVFYLVPRCLDPSKANVVIPLEKFTTGPGRVLSGIGKGFTGIDVGLSYYNAISKNIGYVKKRGISHWLSDVYNQDPDAMDVVNSQGLLVNSFMGASGDPGLMIISVEFSTMDLLMNKYGMEIVKREYSRDADYAWLEIQARKDGRNRGINMRNQFLAELERLKKEIRELAQEEHGYSDGLQGCSRQ